MAKDLDRQHLTKWQFVKCMVAHLHVENNFHFVTTERSSFSALENVMVSTIAPMVLMNGVVLKNVATLSPSKARSTNLVSLII